MNDIDELLMDLAEAEILKQKQPKLLWDYLRGIPMDKISEKNEKWCKQVDEFCEKHKEK